MYENRPTPEEVLHRLQAKLPELERVLEHCNDMWGVEDHVYRYHGSFKVFYAQATTKAIVEALQSVFPERTLNREFLSIVRDGTGREFAMEDNNHWAESTRPIVSALFHAHYFLTMACKYSRELDTAPNSMPSGWAALEYLYIWV